MLYNILCRLHVLVLGSHCFYVHTQPDCLFLHKVHISFHEGGAAMECTKFLNKVLKDDGAALTDFFRSSIPIAIPSSTLNRSSRKARIESGSPHRINGESITIAYSVRNTLCFNYIHAYKKEKA